MTFSGLQADDTLTELTQVFDSKNAGNRTLSVVPDYILNDGNSGLNYTVTLNTAIGAIDPAIAVLHAVKTYDGSSQFTADQITVNGIADEMLTLSGSGFAIANSNKVSDNNTNYLVSIGDFGAY